jgi:hypothetical protein
MTKKHFAPAFAEGLVPSSVERTGQKAPYSSDHAGVVAVFVM